MSFRLLCTRLVWCAAGLSIVWALTFAAAPVTSTPASPSGATPTGPTPAGKLVFSSTREGNSQIYKVNADGSDLTKLTNDENQPAFDPNWSPDGTKILFTRTITRMNPESIALGSVKIDSTTKLFVMNADGSEQKRLTDDSPGTESAVESHASWSPDGRRVLFFRSPPPAFAMYIVNSDGSDEKQIGPNDLETLGFAATLRLVFNGPRWSPDGKAIVFEIATRIWTMNSDGLAFTNGETIRELTAHPNNGASARFSPDGSEIAFASNRDGDFEIFVMSRDGSDQRPLTNNQIADFDPTWSPNGSTILFARDSTHDMEDLWLLDRDTLKERRIVEQVDALARVIFLGDDWIAVERWSSDDDQDIEVIAIDGSTSYILADAPAFDSLGSWHPEESFADVTSGAAEPARSPAWPLAAIGIVGIVGVCTGAWYWTRGKASGTASSTS